MSPIRVLIADDHHLVRQGIHQVLSETPGFEIVGEAADGLEALRLAQSLAPDVTVLDVSMPGLSGIEVAVELRKQQPDARILMLSVYDHQQYVVEAVRVGAQGYLRKDTDPAELRTAIRALARGESYFSPAVARHLSAAVRGEAGPPEPSRQVDILTRRERQVLQGIARGSTNKEIASELGLSSRTVESYRESLMRKLGIYTVAGLTRLALEAGLLEP